MRVSLRQTSRAQRCSLESQPGEADIPVGSGHMEVDQAYAPTYQLVQIADQNGGIGPVAETVRLIAVAADLRHGERRAAAPR